EGYELAVSRPEVIIKEINGELQEPYETLTLDIEEIHQGMVMEKIAARRALLAHMMSDGNGRMRLDYMIPTRGLIGFHNEFLNITSGTGLMHHIFDHYGPLIKGEIAARINGVLVANQDGKATAYALWNLESRGRLLIGPQTIVYEGMIVGLHSRE